MVSKHADYLPFITSSIQLVTDVLLFTCLGNLLSSSDWKHFDVNGRRASEGVLKDEIVGGRPISRSHTEEWGFQTIQCRLIFSPSVKIHDRSGNHAT